MNNSDNVSAGKPKVSGAMFAAVAGTAVPTDATSPLVDAYKNLGYISEDGVTNAIETDTEDVAAWGGEIVLNTQKSYKETFEFTCIETSVETLSEYYGEGNVTLDGNTIKVKHSSEEPSEHPWVIETVLKGGRVQRTVIPRGKISERGEIVFKDDEPIGYTMTISALPDETQGTAYTYIATPVAP